MPAATVLKTYLEEVGRERGPDIALKSDKLNTINNAKLVGVNVAGTGNAAGYNVDQFNITEVLNVIAAISNGTRTGAASVDPKYSAFIPDCGGINTGTGAYADAVGNAGSLVTQINSNVYDSIFHQQVGLDAVIFDFDALRYIQPGNNVKLPQCLLKRSTTADGTQVNANTILDPLELDRLNGELQKFIGDVFRQGFSILEKTRDVFGPKGWTALFTQVKGGGSSRSKHAKRTHRQHRRRYSSKQY